MLEAENLSVFENQEPAGTYRPLLTDAKGIVELAATRLIRESTASRVRDILPVRYGGIQMFHIYNQANQEYLTEMGLLPYFVAQ